MQSIGCGFEREDDMLRIEKILFLENAITLGLYDTGIVSLKHAVLLMKASKDTKRNQV